jgi:hypothetical protein
MVPWQLEPCTQQERHTSPLLYESTLLGIHLQRMTALKLLYSALLVPSMLRKEYTPTWQFHQRIDTCLPCHLLNTPLQIELKS